MRRLRGALILTLVVMLAAMTEPATAQMDYLWEQGLSSDHAAAAALVLKAGKVSSRTERLDLLSEAVAHAPDLPGLHFHLARASLPDVFESMDHIIGGLRAYRDNFWWSLGLAGLLGLSASLSLSASFLIIGLLRLFQDLPLLSHEMAEQKWKLLVPLIVAAIGLAGPLFALAGLLVLSGPYMKGIRKFVVYLGLSLLLAAPLLQKGVNLFVTASTPSLRAIAAVQQGTDNTLALEELAGSGRLAERFSYALALKREGRLTEAERVYLSLIADRPTARLYTNLGNVYHALGLPDLARQSYEMALELERSPELLFNLSQIDRDALNFESGDRYYDEAMAMDKDAVSRFAAVASPHSNRFVVDITLSQAELWTIALDRMESAVSLFLLPPFTASALGALLFALFLVLDRSTENRAYRCPECGKVVCRVCMRNEYHEGKCMECHRIHSETTSPQARVKRMLAANQQKSRRRRVIRFLSFGLPGIAQTYAGRTLGGLLYLWVFLFSAAVVVMDPLLSTGMAGYHHGWPMIPAAAALVFTYILAVVSVSRRLDRGWL